MSQAKCWNCGSTRYFETAQIESCPDCGIRCDYHGSGANDAYNAAMARQHAAERAAEEARWAERRREDEREADFIADKWE